MILLFYCTHTGPNETPENTITFYDIHLLALTCALSRSLPSSFAARTIALTDIPTSCISSRTYKYRSFLYS